MRTWESRGYGWSLVGHLAAGLLIAVMGLFHGFSCQRQPKELVLPIEFLVDVSQLPEPEPEPPAPEPPAPETPPPPAPPKPDPKKEEPKKVEERKKPPVKISTNVVRRAQTPKPLPKPLKTKPPTGPKLTPEEIAKLLAMGAKASDRTVIPGEDERALSIIKNALYAAWILPSSDQKGRRPAQFELRLDRFGVVTGRRLLASSGSPAMDRSVENAAAAVRQVRNLPAGFTDRFPSVIIDFELE